MATLLEDDKLLKDQQGQGGQQAPGSQSSALMQPQGAGGAMIGASPAQGVSTAGVKAGGTGGWTNFQAYLAANQGNTASADKLKTQGSQVFDTEKTNLTTKATDAKTQATQSVEQNRIGQDAASRLIDQAAKNYRYEESATQPQQPTQPGTGGGVNLDLGGRDIYGAYGRGGAVTAPGANVTNAQYNVGRNADTYNQAVGQLSGSLNAQYGGPTSFEYGMGADAQRYGEGVTGNNTQFNSLMDALYKQNAGGQIGKGALMLQRQLDTNSDAVAQARQDLAGQYQGLNSTLGSTLTDTNAALAQARTQFGQDQEDLRGYLNDRVTHSNQAIEDAVKAFTDAELERSRFYKPEYADMNTINAIDGGQVKPQDALNMYNTFKNDANYWKYVAGDTATKENIRGADQSRDQYNALMDALGMGGSKLGRAEQAPKSGYYDFDESYWIKNLLK